MDVIYYILSPFSWLLTFLNHFFGSYGLAVMCFAVVIKLILFPFSIKSKRSMIQMNSLSGRMKQLQKQYGKDQARYNTEVQKLYEKEKVNPMSGCLWSLIPMFVLLPLYAIIRQPLKYLMGLSQTQIVQIAESLDWGNLAVVNNWATADAIQKAASGSAASLSGFVNSGYNQLYLSSLINEGNLSSLQAITGSESLFAINFNFFGLNLASIANWRIWENLTWAGIGLVILILISAGTGFLLSMITMRTNRMNQNGPQDETMERTNRTMMLTMPVMSLWIGFVMPAGLVVYWIVNNLLSIVQEFIAGKILKKDYETARMAAEERKQREKEEEKELKRQRAEERAREAEEAKKNRGKKKPQKKEIVQSGINKDNSRVGIRAYARGRNYDPNRFGTVTEYRDASGAVEEEVEELPQPIEETRQLQEAAVSDRTEETELVSPQTMEQEEVELEEVELEEIEIELEDEDEEEGT